MKNFVVKLFLFSAAWAGFFLPKALAANSVVFQGVEIGPLIAYYQDYVYQLDRPITVFSAVSFLAPNSLTSPLSTSDEVGSRFVQAATQDYWAGAPDLKKYRATSSNPGLMAQLDPIAATKKIKEAGTPNWALLRIELPTGFKFVNFIRDGDNSAPKSLTPILKALGCVPNDSKYSMVSELSTSYWRAEWTICQRAVREIAKKYLKVDGFFWRTQGAAYLKECAPKKQEGGPLSWSGKGFPDREGAFNLVSGAKLSESSVFVYNAQTRADFDMRLRWQSLVYKAAHDRGESGELDWAYASDMANYPGFSGWTMMGTSTTCTGPSAGGQSCQYAAFLCPPGIVNAGDPSCVQAPVATPPKLPFPTVISRATLPENQILLWPDLEGASTSEDLSPMLREKFFGCSETAPYSLAK